MSKAEIVSVIIAILSFIFSLISFIRSSAYTKGQVEISVRNMISSARNQFMEATKNLNDEEGRKTFLTAVFEEYLNAYDEACAKYIDCKIDKERFKKMYIVEIRNLVENAKTKSFFDPTTSKYKAILKVYKEWNDLEN